MDNKVSPAASKELRERLRPVVTEHLSNSIPRRSIVEISENTALEVLRPLVHMLSRSLPHVIAPALAHTLHHAPAQDYICYACYNDGKYCKFCHYSPVHAYYAYFYAGVYSQFYSDYYGDYYFSFYEKMMLAKENNDQPRETRDTSQSKPSEYVNA